MSPTLLAPVLVLLVVAAAALIAGRRAAARRRVHEERRRLRRHDLEVDHTQDPNFHSWRAEEFSFEHEAKRAEAEQASRTADVYAHLAEEQEVRAAELTEESEDAAARAGLEDIRVRRLETDPGGPAAPGE